MSTAALERLEYEAWHLAAEPSQQRMDDLLTFVVRHAREIAKTGSVTRKSPETLVSEPVLVTASEPEEPQDSPEGRVDSVWYVCSTCHEAKPEDDFGSDKASVRGRRYACRVCESRRRRERRAAERRALGLS